MNNQIQSYTTFEAQSALWVTGRSSRVCGHGDPPLMPYYQNGWKLEALKPDLESTMPMEVRTRLNIVKSVTPIKCILIAHEEKPQPKPIKVPKEVLDAISGALGLVGTILGALVSVLVGGVGLVIGLGLSILMMVDPVVIVVLEDGTWLEVAKWYD